MLPGALTWKGGMGMSGGQDPLFTPFLPFFRSPVAAWFSSIDPHFEQKYHILTPTREICQISEEISALQPKFGSNFSYLAPKSVENFQFPRPYFRKKKKTKTKTKKQFFRPPFRRFAPDKPTINKVECPPGKFYDLGNVIMQSKK